MKPTVVLICFLLLVMPALPAAAAETGPDVTQEIIRGVTLEPVPEPTTKITRIVTLEPTKEPTKETIVPPTSLHIVTETPEKPVTMPTEKTVTITESPGTAGRVADHPFNAFRCRGLDRREYGRDNPRHRQGTGKRHPRCTDHHGRL